jgi:hypothetical protein
MNTNENITTTTVDDDLFLPEGWAEGADIFSPDTWGATEAQADESAAEVASVEEQVEAEASTEAPTPESTDLSGDTAGDVDTAPTPEQTEAEPAHKLKFKARVDRADLDVELNESELPTIYQKAQVTDRLSAKLDKLNPQMEKVERLAKTLGFQSIGIAGGGHIGTGYIHTKLLQNQAQRMHGSAADAGKVHPPTRGQKRLQFFALIIIHSSYLLYESS